MSPNVALSLKRENMAAFEVDFRLPWNTPLGEKEVRAHTVTKRAIRPLPRRLH
jgi:hypothetical protein